jgi:flagellar hook-length control protein FliK
LCNAAAGVSRKNQQKAAPKHWPALCDGFAGSSSGFLRVRASATSRLAPPAGFHAARSDSNTPKTDEASPFALLVGAATPPAQKPPNTSGGKSDEKPEDGKTTSDQANAAQTTQNQTAAPASNSQPSSPPANDSDQDDQAATDQNATPAPDIQQADLNAAPLAPVAGDNQAVSDSSGDVTSDQDSVSLWPQSARPQPQTGQTGKPVKTDKGDKKDVTDQPDAAAVVATDLLPPDLQVAAVTPPPAPQAIVPPITDDSDQAEIAAAPAIAPATQPGAPQPTDQIAPPNPDATTPQTASQDASQAADQAAPQAPAAGTPPAPKTISSAPAALASTANEGPSQNDTDQPQISLPKDAPAVAPAKGPPKPVAAKTDVAAKTVKPSSGNPQQLSDPAAVKSADTLTAASTDDADDKPDTVKSAAPTTDAAAPKLAANIANIIAIPPAGQPGLPQAQATDFTQHIQVSAQPHDSSANLPALAVDIVAKSLGGAKQFDIRLDPPELGRVEVRLSIDATGKASAHLSADQPQTLTLLQRDASVLTRALRDAGLDVSQNGLNFSLRQQSGQDSGAGANPGRRSGRGLSLTATTSIEATAASAAYSGPADGRLDIKV